MIPASGVNYKQRKCLSFEIKFRIIEKVETMKEETSAMLSFAGIIALPQYKYQPNKCAETVRKIARDRKEVTIKAKENR